MRNLPSVFNKRNTGLTKSFDNFFDSFFTDLWSPIEPFTTDIYKSNYKKLSDDKSVLFIEMPGYNKKDINVEFKEDDHLLTISAERTEDKEYYSKNTYNRQWTLSEHLKVDEVKLRDGVLKIFFKDESPPEKKPIQIEVK